MRKLLFVVMAVLAVTTACGSNAGTDSSKSEKQESMELQYLIFEKLNKVENEKKS